MAARVCAPPDRPGALRRVWSARRFLTDWSVIVLAAAVALGALRPVPVPVVVPVILALGACAARRPVLVVLVAPVLAGALAQQAVEGAAPAAPARVDGVGATLVSDPQDAFGGARALVRAQGHHYEVRARGSAAGQLRRALAGEGVSVSGRVEPRRAGDERLLTRHVVGSIEADDVTPVHRGDPASRVANAFRRLLDRGAEPLDPVTRGLFGGFVLGDDRFQDAATIDAFRATGLGHLLVVSGENVAFVGVLLRPVLSRTGLGARFALMAGALVLFALLTRFEPSVLRATAMALIATWASTLGRPVSALRCLALAVTALVLIDPLLVRAPGFQLSAAASAGIILLAPRLAARLPGPRLLAELASVSLAAQAFVAPLLMGSPEGLPIASLPANVLAVPAAGPLMMWGLTGGVAAGLVGGSAAGLLHIPTRLLVWWVRTVSVTLAGLPLGRLATPHVLVLGAVVLAGVLARRLRPGARGTTFLPVVAAAAVLVAAAVPRAPVPRSGPGSLGVGAELWPTATGGALVLDGRAQAGVVLTGLRTAGVRALDVVVARTASRSAAVAVRAVAERLPVGAVLAPAGAQIAGAVTPDGEVIAVADGLELHVVPAGGALRVDARPAADTGVASPGASPLVRSRAPPGPGAGTGRPAGAVARGTPLRHRAPGRGDGHPQPHPGLVLRPRWLLGVRRLLAQG
jgi:competence protein ComEC